METSKHLGLQLPGYDDFADVEIINGNMRKLDEHFDPDVTVGKSVVTFTKGSWASAVSGGYKVQLTITKEQHLKRDGSFTFELRHTVGGKQKTNTWAVNGTEVEYNADTREVLLKAEDAYDGEITFIG